MKLSEVIRAQPQQHDERQTLIERGGKDMQELLKKSEEKVGEMADKKTKEVMEQ